MPSCGPVEFLRGGTFRELTLLDVSIIRGVAEDLTLKDASLTGTLNIDQSILDDLALQLGSVLSDPDPAKVAAVFRDSTNGLPLVPDTEIMTKLDYESKSETFRGALIAGYDLFKIDINHAISDLTTKLDNDIATFETKVDNEIETFKTKVTDDIEDYKTSWQVTLEQAVDPVNILGNLKSGSGLALGPGVKVATWDELVSQLAAATSPSKIAEVFSNSDGQPMSPGTRLMSASQIEAAIRLGVCEGCGSGGGGGGGGGTGGMAISNVEWVTGTSTLTITETDGVTTAEWPVTLTGLAPTFEASAESPTYDVDSYLPTSVFGQRTGILGTPNLWLGPITVAGVQYAIPAFALPVI
ncbi:MAG: hypothetical protein LBS60_08960 [Deltaproteobacteria bacterium]|jgi:hypothetical protein|nr:hypothetical protein [Deltaproteobacteria bacterium]